MVKINISLVNKNQPFIREIEKGLKEADKGEFVEYDYDSLMKEVDEEL